MWKETVVVFQEYMGIGLVMILFLVALVYLWLEERRKYLRILLIYMPAAVLLLYFNPLFSRLVYAIAGDEIYYRILWLLPITLTISYTGVSVCGKLYGRTKQLFAICIAGVIALSGSYVYGNPYFHKAENLYHVPDSVVAICDAIHVPGREVMAVFPAELLQYVRQYSAVTCMPYGREVLVPSWNFLYPLFDVMEAEVIDMEKLVPMVREAGCHYVVLRKDKEIIGDPADYKWELFEETAEYAVYRDPFIELIAPVLQEE